MQPDHPSLPPSTATLWFLTAFAAVALLLPLSAGTAGTTNRPPNVIIIMTDDQGYGELAAHGNPVIQTPHMDRLHAESVRLTDFHVDPTCSPTRAALLTGRDSTRTGVWHTINGRSMINPAELTMAEVFKANGYTTGMVGKWHLGDNYPCRPQDQGFDHAVWHLGGGVGNGPDFWENDYNDDTFVVNGEWQKFDGYCTDVWFREACKFVEKQRDQPFFLYLSTNAPHEPYIVPEKYAALYEASGMPPAMAKFYGMITNIDENLGHFRKHLDDLGLSGNTLLIFLTDNGTTAGWIDRKAGYDYFNAGMRGWKGSAWDGGHRVPCFWHWPAKGITGGRDATQLTAHIDILPTLIDLLDLKKPEGPIIDGVSLQGILSTDGPALPDRTLFVHVQREFLPPKWNNSVAMTPRWRLIDGGKLYDINSDPSQQVDVATEHPEIVQRLRDDYEEWWASLATDMQQTVRYGLGGNENPMTLNSHDWLMPGTEPAAWHQNHIKRGALINGPWAVDVKRAGTYEITLHRWAPYLERPMLITSARLQIGEVDERNDLKETATEARFQVNLNAGPAMLQTWLTRANGESHGAYYTQVRLLEE